MPKRRMCRAYCTAGLRKKTRCRRSRTVSFLELLSHATVVLTLTSLTCNCYLLPYTKIQKTYVIRTIMPATTALCVPALRRIFIPRDTDATGLERAAQHFAEEEPTVGFISRLVPTIASNALSLQAITRFSSADAANHGSGGCSGPSRKYLPKFRRDFSPLPIHRSGRYF